MILSDKSIVELNAKGLLVEQLLKDKQIQPNSIDLSLANSYKRLLPNVIIEDEELKKIFFSTKAILGERSPLNEEFYLKKYIDLSIPMQYEEGLIEEKTFALKSGEFILMASNEKLKIPNGIVGIVCGRSSVARVALQTEQAGFVDAGFEGTITFEMFNQSKYSIIIPMNMRIAQVYFVTAEESDRLYGKGIGSKYNGQIVAQESLIHMDFIGDE